MIGDAKLALKAMADAVEASGVNKKSCPWGDWVKKVQSMVESWNAAFQKKTSNYGLENAINPYYIIQRLNAVFGPDDIVVADTGYQGAYGNACIETKAPGRKYLRTSGSLGWGFPASLGAQCAVKEKSRVICLTGDGGIGYHVSDIETAVRCNLPVIVIIPNNSSLGFEYHSQKYAYNDVVSVANDFLDIDYGAIAKEFGAFGEKVTKPEEVDGALKRAIEAGKTAVLDFKTDKEQYAPVASWEGVEVREV